MMRFSTLMKHPAEWMTGGRHSGAVVLTSRIRLARNLSGRPFPGWATREQRIGAMVEMRPVIEGLEEMKGGYAQELGELSAVQKQVLVERHLISREHAARSEGAAMVVDRAQSLSIMINEEDHLRMQAIRQGIGFQEAYEALAKVDGALEEPLQFAFDPRLGYLTACPTNLGTGMRASAMVHLPGLFLAEQIEAVLHGVGKLGLAVRGLYGEGTESLGHLYQISNQSTLGEREEEIIARLERVVREVEQHELNARAKLEEDRPTLLSDRIGRAYGALKYAHVMDSKEALNHLSLVRMGACMQFFDQELQGVADRLLLQIQPAHLQMEAKQGLSPEERDEERAKIIRQALKDTENSCVTKKLNQDLDSK